MENQNKTGAGVVSIAIEKAEAALRPVYKDLSDEAKGEIAKIKELGIDLFIRIAELPPSRESSLALTKLEEAVMWAVKAITK